jgi:hypothetical protein
MRPGGQGSAVRFAVRRGCCRFAPAHVAHAAGRAGAPLSGLPCAGIRPERRGFSVLRGFDDLRALAIGPRSTGLIGGPEASARVAPVAPAIGAPARPAAPTPRRWWKTIVALGGGFGIDGPRRRHFCSCPTSRHLRRHGLGLAVRGEAARRGPDAGPLRQTDDLSGPLTTRCCRSTSQSGYPKPVGQARRETALAVFLVSSATQLDA